MIVTRPAAERGHVRPRLARHLAYLLVRGLTYDPRTWGFGLYA